MRRLSAVVQLFRLFANPLVIILLVASAIAASLGQQFDALIIVTMVALGVAINFWQSYRSQQAAERLRSSVIPTATVLRDGAWLETPVQNVVPGDVFRLSAGDLVPADGRLLESRDLSVQQSMLTGESLPADKRRPPPRDDRPQRAAPRVPWHVGRKRHRNRSGARDRAEDDVLTRLPRGYRPGLWKRSSNTNCGDSAC